MFINFDWLTPTLGCGGKVTKRWVYDATKRVLRRGARTHKCGIRVPTMMSSKARYDKYAVNREVATPLQLGSH